MQQAVGQVSATRHSGAETPTIRSLFHAGAQRENAVAAREKGRHWPDKYRRGNLWKKAAGRAPAATLTWPVSMLRMSVRGRDDTPLPVYLRRIATDGDVSSSTPPLP